MKGCVPFAILWFAFTAMTDTTTVTQSSTESSAPTTTVASRITTGTTTVTQSSTESAPPTTVTSIITTGTTTGTQSSTESVTPTTTVTSTGTTTSTQSSTKSLSPGSTVASTITDTTTVTQSSTKSSPPTTTVASRITTGTTTGTQSSTESVTPTTTVTSTDTTTVTQSSTESSAPTTTVTSPSSTDNTTDDGNSTESTSPTANSSPHPGTTTVTQSSTKSSAPTTTVTSTITTASPCEKNPCVSGAECINLFNQSVCQCSFGLYYVERHGCQQGKIFPGELSLKTVPYDESMKNKDSAEYEELYKNVTQLCESAFVNRTDYKQTIILSVNPSASRLKILREGETTVVSLINMFTVDSALSRTEAQKLLQQALNTTFSGSTFNSKDQCATGKVNCDNQTTTCTEKEDNTVATCECKSGLAKKNDKDTSCLLCDQCSQENNKQCVLIADGIPKCQCLPDFSDKDGRCQECDFGYSGEACKDNYLAVIVGVSVACGIVIIVLAGVLIYKSLRAKKKPEPERRGLLSNDYSATSQGPASKSATNVTPAGIFPRIPTGNAASQGSQARTGDEGGLANNSYLPDRDYDYVDPASIEMATRKKF